MNVYIFVTRYPCDSNTQSNIFVHEQCLVLKEMGHRIVVLEEKMTAPSEWRKSCFNGVARREWEGVTVYTHCARGIATTKLLSFNQRLYVRGMHRLFKYVVQREGKPDVIYAHFVEKAGVAACFAGKEHKIPVVVIEHGGLVMGNRHTFFLRKWLNFVLDHSCALICVSEAQKKCVEKYTGSSSKIRVVPNMVDKRFTYKERILDDRFVFFSAGNLNRGKCMGLLVRAFDMAFRSDDNVELRIAGAGKERKHLETYIAKQKIRCKVKLLGRLNRDRMLDEYRQCSVFAMASDHESFGIVYREALCVGRPVVSTDNGGIRDGWNDFFGLIVPKNSLSELVHALKTIYENYESYDLRLISRKCLEFTSPNIVMKKIEDVLKMTCDS